MQRQTFPSPQALRRLPFGLADVVVFAGALALLAVVARVGAGAIMRFVPPDVAPHIDLNLINLPSTPRRPAVNLPRMARR